MKLLTANVNNFVSYNNLEFNFNDQGLALIYGATGSGKSTLQDIPAWVIFNITAKNTAVDEVRNWNAINTPTTGTVTIELSGEVITVTRIRGKANQNDLYWEDSNGIHRGKDIQETQTLLEKRLGVSKDLYVAAAYYNEFSPTASFFTNKAKDRRELFENLADLSFPVLLAEKATAYKKTLNSLFDDVNRQFNKQFGTVEAMNRNKELVGQYYEKWEKEHADKIHELKQKQANADKEKKSKIAALQSKVQIADDQLNKKIKELQDWYDAKAPYLDKILNSGSTCKTCKQPIKKHQDLHNNLEEVKFDLMVLKAKENPHLNDLKKAQEWVNTYDLQLQIEQDRKNPYGPQLDKIIKDLQPAEDLLLQLNQKLEELQHKIDMVKEIYDLSFKLRGELLKRAVKEVEENTNRLLQDHFDGLLRVAFELSKSDDLNVTIQLNGHECAYRQLSKGQRGLLKLCFSVSVMSIAANKAGTKFDTLFFDEALDGLDTELKLKAFNLFAELGKEHGSVFVIDHNSELQTLFDKQFHVKLVSDESEITKQ